MHKRVWPWLLVLGSAVCLVVCCCTAYLFWYTRNASSPAAILFLLVAICLLPSVFFLPASIGLLIGATWARAVALGGAIFLGLSPLIFIFAWGGSPEIRHLLFSAILFLVVRTIVGWTFK